MVFKEFVRILFFIKDRKQISILFNRERNVMACVTATFRVTWLSLGPGHTPTHPLSSSQICSLLCRGHSQACFLQCGQELHQPHRGRCEGRKGNPFFFLSVPVEHSRRAWVERARDTNPLSEPGRRVGPSSLRKRHPQRCRLAQRMCPFKAGNYSYTR